LDLLVQDAEDVKDVEKVFERKRALLKPDEKEFLEEILAADEFIMERQKRGIVDQVRKVILNSVQIFNKVRISKPFVPVVNHFIQILATISGVGSGFGILGGAPQPQYVYVPVATAVVQPIETTKAPTALKSDINSTTTTNATSSAAVAAAAPTAAPSNSLVGSASQTMNNDNHLFSMISQVIRNSNSRNVSGIVNAALSIGTPAPVRDLVNGIIGVAYCNGIRRLLGRC
jgi:hypothetical protein